MKNEKQFIRVEHKISARGMFGCDNYLNPDGFRYIEDIEDLSDLYNRHGDFPNMWNDEKIAKVWDKCKNNNWRFAFKSINQIQKWIMKKEFKILAENDFRIFRITATNYTSSQYQAIFDIKSVINKIDITDLFL